MIRLKRYKATRANITKILGNLNSYSYEVTGNFHFEGDTVIIEDLLDISKGSAVPSISVNGKVRSRSILGYSIFEGYEFFEIR